MRLAIEPESLESARARFPDALVRRWDADFLRRVGGEADRPGQHRENVFDLEDGVRLIVSRDAAEGRQFLHVSGSVAEGGSALNGVRSGEDAIALIVRSFLSLSGYDGDGVGNVAVSPGGVVHVIFKLATEVAAPE